ncbi:MAG: FHA domain-containing protein [Chloroflexi bacterium]|nr:FHA domain-containing protein [Chloroflexota bacterium]
MERGDDPTFLRIRGGPDHGTTMGLSEGPVVIGRGPDNDIDIDEETVSRRHALIVPSSRGRHVLRDLSSSNGTFVNRDRLGHQERILRHGDRIRVAGSGVTFIFQDEGSETVVMHPGRAEADSGADDEPGVEQDARLEMDEDEIKLLELLESRTFTAVSKEEIAEYLWPEYPVKGLRAARAMTKAIERLREHLGDDPRDPRRLITAGDYGFLLVEGKRPPDR